MKNIFNILLILLLFVSCTDEEVASRPYSRVRTNSVVMISDKQALFLGEITYVAAPLEDYGFVWSSTATSFTINSGHVISLGSRNNTGKFKAETGVNFPAKGVSYVKAYVISGGYTVYGETVDFAVKE